MPDKLVDKILKRKSPLGITEYVFPPELESQYFSPTVKAFTRGNEISYRQQYANDPEVMSHERIHVGQNYFNQPSKEEILRALEMPDTYDYEEQPEKELPAYRFAIPFLAEEEDKKRKSKLGSNSIYTKSLAFAKIADKKKEIEQQNQFNNYMKLMRSINLAGIQPLEAAMPDSLMRQLLKTQPQPIYTPQVIK